jgi:hypothetical protein
VAALSPELGLSWVGGGGGGEGSPARGGLWRDRVVADEIQDVGSRVGCGDERDFIRRGSLPRQLVRSEPGTSAVSTDLIWWLCSVRRQKCSDVQ